MCSDCDGQEENKRIFSILCGLRSALYSGIVATKEEEDLLVKPDVFQEVTNNSKDNVSDSIVDYESETKEDDFCNEEDGEDFICYPQKVH